MMMKANWSAFLFCIFPISPPVWLFGFDSVGPINSASIILSSGNSPTLVACYRCGDLTENIVEFNDYKIERSKIPLNVSVAFNLAISEKSMEKLLLLCNTDADRKEYAIRYGSIISKNKPRLIGIRYLKIINIGRYSMVLYEASVKKDDGRVLKMINVEYLALGNDGLWGITSDINPGDPIVSLVFTGKQQSSESIKGAKNLVYFSLDVDVGGGLTLRKGGEKNEDADMLIAVDWHAVKNGSIFNYDGEDELMNGLKNVYATAIRSKEEAENNYWRPSLGSPANGNRSLDIITGHYGRSQSLVVGYINYECGRVVYVRNDTNMAHPVFVRRESNGGIFLTDVASDNYAIGNSVNAVLGGKVVALLIDAMGSGIERN